MSYRQNQCSVCGGYGHNPRGCPAIKEAHAKVSALIEKYSVQLSSTNSWAAATILSEINDAITAQNPGVTHIPTDLPEENLTYREVYRWLEALARKRDNEHRKEYGRKRTCGFCGQQGHNRRTCQDLEEHQRECRAVKALAHRIAKMTFEEAGLVPGALVSYRRWCYEAGVTKSYVGMVQSIDWSVVAKQDEGREDGKADNFEPWFYRNSPILVKEGNGSVQRYPVPRGISQQTDYYYSESEQQYTLLSPVHGGKVNTDGYTGDSEFPISSRIWFWGDTFVDKAYGRRVKKLITAVGGRFEGMK